MKSILLIYFSLLIIQLNAQVIINGFSDLPTTTIEVFEIEDYITKTEKKIVEAKVDETGKDIGVIHTSFEDFGQMQKALEEKGIPVISAKLERIAQSTSAVTEEQAADVFKLIDKLEEDDDVQAVYHNMAE